jgi:hypothetical protein
VNNRKKLALIGLIFLLASIACQELFPKTNSPGSLQDKMVNGSVHFEGKGNLSYLGCQDPTAIVSLTVSGQVKEYEGVEYYDFINPVIVSAETDGLVLMADTCEKGNLDEKHNWPAKGIYYPKEEKILFFSCSLQNGKADGEAYLSGEGSDLYFEGEYSCYSEDGSLIYEVGFTAFPVEE